CGVAAAAAIAAVASVQAAAAPRVPAPAGPSRHHVTLNLPDPRAPGGVFASGGADGRPWRLAVRDIASVPTSCIPAIMLNGRDGDVLFPASSKAPALRNPAFLTDAPGL